MRHPRVQSSKPRRTIALGVMVSVAIAFLVVTLVQTGPLPSALGTPQAGHVTHEMVHGAIDFDAPQPLDAYRRDLVARGLRAYNLAVAECMNSAGYPELLEVIARVPEGEPFPNLRVSSGAFGPDSDEDAVQFGYLPTFLREASQEPPQVVSADPTYGENIDTCAAAATALFVTEDGTDVLSRYVELGNQLSADFAGVLDDSPVVVEAFDDWLSCMSRHSYNASGVGEYLGSMHPPTFFGVETGQFIGSTEGVTKADEKQGGVVRVLQPPDVLIYQPSGEEVALALADVACKAETNLWARVFPELLKAEADIVVRHQEMIAELTDSVASVLDATEG